MHLNLRSRPSGTLRRALLANAAFSAFSGSLMVFAEASVLSWLGLDSFAILPIGAFLLAFALYLLWMGNHQRVPADLVKGVIAGDWAWVIASVLLLLFKAGLFSTTGILLIIDVAVIVGVFAIMQSRGLRLATAPLVKGN